MNLSTSHCSSGFESGWTVYLDQSSVTKSQYGFSQFVDEDYTRNGDEDAEEDLSMVSDASSGPPRYRVEDEDYYDECAKKNKNKKGKEHGRSQQYLYSDDTTSSPELNKKITENESSMEHELECSHGFSANTHSKEKSGTKKHFGFFRSDKSTSNPSGSYQGRKWK